MAFKISDFRTNGLLKGGARANLFEVSLDFTVPLLGWSTVQAQSKYLCKVGQIPGSTLGVATVSYFGREVKIPGNRTLENLSLTFLNDEDWKLREALENWLNQLNDVETNVSSKTITNSTTMGAISMLHYGKEGGSAIATYKFHNVWPLNVSTIDLAWDTNDAVEEYTAEFSYDWWTMKL